MVWNICNIIVIIIITIKKKNYILNVNENKNNIFGLVDEHLTF